MASAHTPPPTLASSAATATFQLALPFLLANAAPSLAALHATRARLLYPADATLAGSHCLRCGYPLVANDSQTRSIRRKRRKTNSGQSALTRVLRRSCRTCGHDEDVPLRPVADAPAPTFPSVRYRTRRKTDSTALPHASRAAHSSPAELNEPIPVSLPPRSTEPIASSPTPAPSRPGSRPATPNAHLPSPAKSAPTQEKARSKSRQKKAGLQNLLARNRERQEQEKQREGGQSQGLSSFLQGL